MKTPPQPKAPRARVMTLQEYDGLTRSFTLIPKQRDGVHYSVLPHSKEAQEAMILEGAKAIHTRDEKICGKGYKAQSWTRIHPSWKNAYLAKSRAVLASANLVEKE